MALLVQLYLCPYVGFVFDGIKNALIVALATGRLVSDVGNVNRKSIGRSELLVRANPK
ncbi:hypothetical protein S7335_5594 [Synechococcus sp. PCC 7335]|nr:hypothetical protein S7335_5594 [Synechococcus sp. PCC 7335]